MNGENIVPKSVVLEDELKVKSDAVVGAVMSMFQAFGGGPARGSECLRLSRKDIQFSGDYFFYETVVNKPQSRSEKVRRQLPASSTSLVLLALFLLPAGKDGQVFDRSASRMDGLVANTWAKVFGHSRPVGFHDSRQLFAFVLNCLKKEFPHLNFHHPGKVSLVLRT